MNKEEIKKILFDTGMEENIRGEKLSIHQFAALTNLFYNNIQRI
jgi:16S rRNA A1518/A1519 N6-dimethyltransferase RsmA/KsgA/DIM1 with predicted DNA glycosylase/AP lyase activity